MYKNIFVDKKSETIFIWDDKQGLVTLPLSSVHYAYKKKVGGRYKSIYGDELEKVSQFHPRDPSLFESDVPVETKVLIDAYQDSDEPSEGHSIVFFDIEIDTEGGFGSVSTADKEITAISLYDKTTDTCYAMIVDPENKIKESTKEIKGWFNPKLEQKTKIKTLSYSDEDSLLLAFLNKWEEIQPTIITGWNIDFFDTPYLYNRIKKTLGDKNAKRLSPIGICYFNSWNKKMVIAGVSCLDYILLYKKFRMKTKASYTLGAIGKDEVGIDKIQYDGSLNTLYKSDIEKYIEYNINDVCIVAAIDDKFKYIDLAQNICHVGHVSYENFHMSSRYLEGAILVYLRRNGGFIAPNKPVDGKEEYESQLEDDEDGFEGAFVKPPVPGQYDWVYDLDLTSMYPNIIISLNISPETKMGKINKISLNELSADKKKKELIKTNEGSDEPIEGEELDLWIKNNLHSFDIINHIKNNIVDYEIGGTKYSKDEFKNLLNETKYSLSSNGVLYNQEKLGVIPTILIKWFEERVQMRELAKKYAKEKNDTLYNFYNQRQQVQKILLNSMYGVLGLPIFRFYDKDNAEAVTLTGVDIIKTTDGVINQYYKQILNKEIDYVVYSDTDSCFVQAEPLIDHLFPDIDKKDEKQMSEAILKVTSKVQSFVNAFYDVMAKNFFNLYKPQFKLKRDGQLVDTVHTFEAKQELISKSAFWLAKKRYCQFVINKEGRMLDEPELEVKGIDVVRSSFPKKFQSFMKSFIIEILKKTEKDVIDQLILDFKTKLKDFDVFDVAKNTSVKFMSQKGDKDYNPKSRKSFEIVKGTPAQAKAALHYNDLIKQLGLEKKFEPIYHGSKIKWVYTKQNEYALECMAMKGDGSDPKKILEFIKKYIDREALYTKELRSKLEDFYRIKSWDYPTENTKKAKEFFDF